MKKTTLGLKKTIKKIANEIKLQKLIIIIATFAAVNTVGVTIIGVLLGSYDWSTVNVMALIAGVMWLTMLVMENR